MCEKVPCSYKLGKQREIMTTIEIERQNLALNTIKQAFNTEAGEDSINLFVEHHLDELPQSYWQQHLGSGTPQPAAIVELLQFQSSWREGNVEYFDFTLPSGVTNYVISVHFDSAGTVNGLSMES